MRIKGISGADMMIAAGEKMAEFMGEKNGEQGEGEREAGSEAGGMLVEKFEGTKKLVGRSGLIVGVGCGELRASGKAGAESEEEEDANDDEHLARRPGKGGVVEIGGRSSTPVDIDGDGAARVFWGRWIHEMFKESGRIPFTPGAAKLVRLLAPTLDALQLFAGFEAYGFAGRDIDLFAGAGIAADAGFARLNAEDAEAAQLDALAAAHGLLEGFENGLDGLLGLGTADVGGSDDGVNNVQLDHSSLRRIRGQMLEGAARVVKT
jgi:hypothetical protein